MAGAIGGGEGGTSTRLVGQFLYWLQESPARVFVVATANDVSKLPPELLRRGRFDELFFVDLPAPKEREEMFAPTKYEKGHRMRCPFSYLVEVWWEVESVGVADFGQRVQFARRERSSVLQ